jgi:hypothetical protein
MLLLGDVGDREPDRRSEAADQHVDLLVGDHLLRRRRGVSRVQLVVAGDADHLAAQDAALGVQLLDGEVVALHRRHAVNGSGAGDRIEHADLDRILALRPRPARGDGERDGRKKAYSDPLHMSSLPGAAPNSQ